MSVVRMRRVGAKGEDDMGEKRNRLGIEDLVRFRIRPNALNERVRNNPNPNKLRKETGHWKKT